MSAFGGKADIVRTLLEEQNKLQLNIHCASDSYNFDLRSSETYAAGAITGTWSESTRNAAGTLSGRVEGVGFQVRSQGSGIHRQSELGDAWRHAIRHHQVTRRAGRRAGCDDHTAAWKACIRC